MKIVFLSNYYNHHQSSLSKELYRLTDGSYRFIATEHIPEERLRLGYGKETEGFVLQYEEQVQECQKLIDEAEIVIWGSAPYELLKNRLKNKKLVFAYSERIFKVKDKWYNVPKRMVSFFLKYGRYKNFYMLCSSAYTPLDYSRGRAFIRKTYKWGYFPPIKRYEDVDGLLEKKEAASILWAGRLIPYKQPQLALQVAKRLKEEGYIFQLNVIGCGELETQLQDYVKENGLGDCVKLLGSMKTEQVREYMEKSRVFLFTSNREEGWGAVLNEAMNSACTVVASHAIGATPFLLENGKNGIVYAEGEFEQLYAAVKKMLDEPKTCQELGKNAYDSITNVWNAEVLVARFLAFAEEIKRKGKCDLYESGPLSRAKVLKDNWYKGNGKD